VLTGASDNGDLALEGPASRSSRHLVYVDWVVGWFWKVVMMETLKVVLML
jgi:hypothetical protein